MFSNHCDFKKFNGGQSNYIHFSQKPIEQTFSLYRIVWGRCKWGLKELGSNIVPELSLRDPPLKFSMDHIATQTFLYFSLYWDFIQLEAFPPSHLPPLLPPPSPPGQLETDQKKLCHRLQIPFLSVDF